MSAGAGPLTRRAALAGIGGAALLAAAPAPPAFKLPGPAGRRADAAVLIRAYTLLHPGLARYQDAAQREAAAARLLAEAEAAPTIDALWVAAARYSASVRCGHSFVNPFNQGKALTALVVERADRLPFTFRWLGGHMIVTRALVAAPGLAPGTEILAIDGEPVAALRARLLPLTAGDGHNDNERIARLELRGGRLEPFDILRSVTTRPGAVTARVELEPLGGPRRTVEVPLLAEGARGGPELATDAPFFTAARQGPALVFTMPSWVAYRSKWDWRAFLDAAIDEAIDTNARALIVDLRGNEGGDTLGDAILARLVERPLAGPDNARRVRFRTTPADLNPVLDTWDDSFRSLGVDAAGPNAEGFYTLPTAANPPIEPRGRRFAGKLIVLVDGACSSATFQFAKLVEVQGLGTLVGEPTGGNRRGINGGAYFFVRLPESRLEVDLPLIGYFPPGNPPDAGIVPQVLAPPTRASIAAGTDPGMAAALRLA